LLKKVIDLLTATPAAATPGTSRLATRTPQKALTVKNPRTLRRAAASRDPILFFGAIFYPAIRLKN
jgi:hypothetical protein